MKTWRNVVVTVVVVMLAMLCNVSVAFAAEEEHEVINFTLSEEGVLTADEEFSIELYDGTHVYSNEDSGKYTVNLKNSYKYFLYEDLTEDNMEWFLCNDEYYYFNFNYLEQSWGYATAEALELEVIPQKAINIMKEFDHVITVELYESEEDNKNGITAGTCFDHNLVTSKGTIKDFIEIEINSSYADELYMNETLIHELGHAIVAEVVLNKYASAEEQHFVWCNAIVEALLINETIEENENLNYGIVYDSISDYASSTIVEIPSEAFSAYMSGERTSPFNEAVVETMLKTWEETKK